MTFKQPQTVGPRMAKGKQGKAKAELEALSNVLSTTYGDPCGRMRPSGALTVLPSSRNACASGLV